MGTVIASHELLPQGPGLESLSVETGRVSICVGSDATGCVCPVCGRRSARAHSRYVRAVSDPPWHGISVTLKVRTRRFFVDLLPERSQEGLVAWLRRHPEVEFAAHDRSRIYREALAKGVPSAVQVTDRWHLLHNLAHVLENLLLQKQPVLREAAAPETGPEDRSDGAFGSGPIMPNRLMGLQRFGGRLLATPRPPPSTEGPRSPPG